MFQQQLPPPRFTIHQVDNGWIVVVGPQNRLDLRSLGYTLMQSLQGGLSLSNLMAAIQQGQPQMQGTVLTPDGVGVVPGSAEAAMEAVNATVGDAVNPLAEVQESFRTRIYICHTKIDVMKVLSDELRLVVDFGEDDDDELDTDPEADPDDETNGA